MNLKKTDVCKKCAGMGFIAVGKWKLKTITCGGCKGKGYLQPEDREQWDQNYSLKRKTVHEYDKRTV